jgi:iron(III) transport system ATP-binding protein
MSQIPPISTTSTASPSLLSVRDLSKSFHAQGPRSVDSVSFDLQAGEIVALLGPSGCGKTTTLRLIAGFERPDAGSIHFAGRRLFGPASAPDLSLRPASRPAASRPMAVLDLPPEQRGIGFVFQDYALFPHLSVLENVSFGLGQQQSGLAGGQRLNRRERLERAEQMLGLVGLTIFRDRLPHQLSGGQQQRVALARALAPSPKLILLDEPFSSLDANLRASTRLEVRKILEHIGATALLVTHDQEEAMSFSDRLIVMRAGHIEQDDAPERVYQHPKTAFVASFLGQTNLIAGQRQGQRAQTALGLLELEPPITPAATPAVTPAAHKGPVMLSVRPEQLHFVAADTPNSLSALVLAREFKGHDITYTLSCRPVGKPEGQPGADDGLHLVLQCDQASRFRVGERVQVQLRGRAVVVG